MAHTITKQNTPSGKDSHIRTASSDIVPMAPHRRKAMQALTGANVTPGAIHKQTECDTRLISEKHVAFNLDKGAAAMATKATHAKFGLVKKIEARYPRIDFKAVDSSGRQVKEMQRTKVEVSPVSIPELELDIELIEKEELLEGEKWEVIDEYY
ncbi:hypothetical protein LTR08_008326 [Meristemomyces frigidus]|nr:hypothetical protein LTR08_008326 [Meristemomyces frigidus]